MVLELNYATLPAVLQQSQSRLGGIWEILPRQKFQGEQLLSVPSFVIESENLKRNEIFDSSDFIVISSLISSDSQQKTSIVFLFLFVVEP